MCTFPKNSPYIVNWPILIKSISRLAVHRSAVSCDMFAIMELINGENYHPEVLQLGRRELNKLWGHITKRKKNFICMEFAGMQALWGVGGRVSTLQHTSPTHCNKSCIPWKTNMEADVIRTWQNPFIWAHVFLVTHSKQFHARQPMTLLIANDG